MDQNFNIEDNDKYFKKIKDSTKTISSNLKYKISVSKSTYFSTQQNSNPQLFFQKSKFNPTLLDSKFKFIKLADVISQQNLFNIFGKFLKPKLISNKIKIVDLILKKSIKKRVKKKQK